MREDSILGAVTQAFRIEGRRLELAELKRGHIHDTFVSDWETAEGRRRFVHQRMNHDVFRDIAGLMRNIDLVTRHIREALHREGEGNIDTTLTIVPARDGRLFVQAEDGSCWRTYRYVENSRSYFVCSDPEIAFQAGAACGRFLRYLTTLDPAGLIETIPNFLDTGLRFRELETAAGTGGDERKARCAAELEFAFEHRDLAGSITSLLRSKRLPTRVSHNDTKLNNVLFTADSNKAFCIVDLDTCMPGSMLYDFGDLVRNTAIPADEDETDLDRVELSPELFESIAVGFLEAYGGALTKEEFRLLPVAPRVLALTLGIRFLADYLRGDTYFKIGREHHNLDRARTQFKIVRTLERNRGLMDRILAPFNPD